VNRHPIFPATSPERSFILSEIKFITPGRLFITFHS